MALSNLALFGGAFLTPVFVGLIADSIGYQWTFYFVAIFAAALLPLLIFFCPETAYKREARFDIDTMGNLIVPVGTELLPLTSPNNGKASLSTSDELERGSDVAKADPHPSTSSPPPPPKATFLQSLALFNGRKTDEHYIQLLFRPFPLFFHPGILWACLIQGVMIGFTVLIGVTLAAIFLGPPLWFGELETGYMYTGAFIGAILGFALCGLLGDSSARLLTRWNGGTYEPEFRMVLVLPQVVLGGAGLYGFGWTANEPLKYGWLWPDFFFALVVMGMVCGAVASALYIVDAHRKCFPLSCCPTLFLSPPFLPHPFTTAQTLTFPRRHVRGRLHMPPRLQEPLLLRPNLQRLRLARRSRQHKNNVHRARLRASRHLRADNSTM